ncbi:hypothetical protein PS833_00778 [Pseudomonas fluorescens]|uniref:DUF2971 domain-containing protein n=2 Tax=Pseudomonas fluorescens TaxID=294 RepID=A0A5E7ALE5_PSEFL|nr:hypothetical protein PS833_00778 [Pseudomonas fluorescens]
MREPEKHPLFQLPQNRQVKIWRFMDFTKFVALLESRNLFFSRADLLGDPFEGSISVKAHELRKAEARRIGREFQGIDTAVVTLAGFGDRLWDSLDADTYMQRWTSEWMSISCWHMNEVESAAMWQLYASSGNGVAIQSTYQRLREALPDDVYIGEVKYICYKNDNLDLSNSFSPFMSKRESFSHERELRAIHSSPPSHKRVNPSTGQEERFSAHDVRNSEAGKSFRVDLNQLVERVHISPLVQHWYADLVRSVAQKYGLHAEIKQSDLDEKPIF